MDELFAENPAVANRTVINGYSLIDSQYKPNAATFFVTLKDFKERYSSIERARKENAEAVLQDSWRRSAGTSRTGVFIPIAPPAIPGIGTTGGFEFWIQDKGAGDPARLYELTQQFLAKARSGPELTGLNTTFRAVLAAVAGRSRPGQGGASRGAGGRMCTARCRPSSARSRSASSTSTAGSGMSSSSPTPPTATTPHDITRLYTRSSNGQMVPLSAMVTTEYVTGPDLVPHFNGFPAAQITGSAAAGYSSGEAIKAMEEVAREVLPAGL